MADIICFSFEPWLFSIRVPLCVSGIWALSFIYPFLRTRRTAALAMSTPNITSALGFHHSCWKEGGVNFTSACLVKVPCRQCLTRFWFSKVNLQQLVRTQGPFCSHHSPRRRSLHDQRASPVCLARASRSAGCSTPCLWVQRRKLDRATFNGTLPCWTPSSCAWRREDYLLAALQFEHAHECPLGSGQVVGFSVCGCEAEAGRDGANGI